MEYDLKNELENLRDGLKAESKKDIEAVQNHLDKLDVKLQTINKGYTTTPTGAVDELKTLFKNKTNEIKAFDGENLSLKVAGTMTVAGALTGDGMRTYSTNVASAPNQLVNFADLIPSIQSDTNTFTYPFEAAADGSFADATEDTTKSQIEYNLEMKDVTLSYLAGFVRISRTLINNVPFVQNWLPDVLRRDYLKAENSKFMTATASTVTASTEIITGQNEIEMLINDSAKLMALSYMPDWIVVNPVDYAKILITEKSTGSGYGLPGVVTMSNGFLMLNGLRIVPADWVTANKYLIMDSKYFLKVYTDGLNIKLWEQDGDNITKNNITVRAESNIGFAVTRSDCATYGDFQAV